MTALLSPVRARIVPIFAGLMVGLFISELNETIFSTALPTVVSDLDGVGHMLWVTTAYVLAATITMPVYGKLSDLIGRKQLYVVGLAIFMVGSVVGGLAPNMPVLVLGRIVQGLGSGGLLILVQAIIADVIPARERARYLSAMGGVFAASAILGPVLGGWLTEMVSWRWAFWINLPLGAVAIGLAVAFLPTPPPRKDPVRLDVWGVVTLSTAVTALVLVAAWGGTTYAWTSPVVIGLALVAVLSGLVFVGVEQRAVEPLIPLHLFRERNFTIPTLAALVMAVAMFGTIAYLPTYLQKVDGLSAGQSGLMMLTLVGGLGLTTVGSAQLVTRTGHYRWLPLLSAAAVAVALALLSTLTPQTGLVVTGGYLFLLGAGIGCALQLLVLIVQNALPADQTGTATAANNFFREIGVSIGSAVVGAAFTMRLTTLLADGRPPAEAYNDALTPIFGYLVPLMLVSAVALVFVRPVPLATTVPDP